MYKNAILNSSINQVLGDLGHTDCICVGDCGLPVPVNVKKIDLSVKLGSPTVAEILEELESHMCVEKIILAQELAEQNQEMFQKLRDFFPETECEIISHNELKKRTSNCRAMIRTGDICAYANIILQSGCVF